MDRNSCPSLHPEQAYCPLKDVLRSFIRAPRRWSNTMLIPGGRPLSLSSDWRVRFVRDGSVSRHLNRKSSPSLRLGWRRGVTNKVDGSAASDRGALWEIVGILEHNEENKNNFYQQVSLISYPLCSDFLREVWPWVFLPLMYRWIQVFRWPRL